MKDSNYYEFGSDNRQDIFILKRRTPHFQLTNKNNLDRALINVNGWVFFNGAEEYIQKRLNLVKIICSLGS